MTAEAEVLGELRRLRARVPQLTGALAASADGLVLARDAADADGAEHVAALTATALGVAQRLTDATGQGGFRELLVQGEHGYVATYAAGGSAVLTLLAEPRINVGRLHLEARRSSARIGALVDEALERRPEPRPQRRTEPRAAAQTPVTAPAPAARAVSAGPVRSAPLPVRPAAAPAVPPVPTHHPKEA
ncbi:roadblock/LC7 domain-containing protein [Streptomyces sp. ODS05-4]|uniref:roadblock/LC7 domain-containing protein n=1 Tax=Streptomyces sp. ODS05-4 TaxID=2944939 RepID=UPI00210CBAE0|nr:roadblock/LC7 domain-containing protein [Streptomyces sp. ODS05-4]